MTKPGADGKVPSAQTCVLKWAPPMHFPFICVRQRRGLMPGGPERKLVHLTHLHPCFSLALHGAEMKPDAEGKVPYTGAADCAVKTLKSHGPLQFYSGFSTYIVR
eukprot:1152607-Pelagomonas_calceolata.AAC.5